MWPREHKWRRRCRGSSQELGDEVTEISCYCGGKKCQPKCIGDQRPGACRELHLLVVLHDFVRANGSFLCVKNGVYFNAMCLHKCHLDLCVESAVMVCTLSSPMLQFNMYLQCVM